MKPITPLLVAVSVLGMVLGVVVPAAAFAPAAYTVDVIHRGTGCRKGEASASFDADNSVLQVIYPAFEAVVGKNGKKAHRQCKIKLRIHSPERRRYAVTSVYQRGYVDLAPGASATFRSSYGQSADRERVVATGDWRASGETIADTFFVGMETDPDDWSACGKHEKFHITTTIDVVGKSPEHNGSRITIDSTDANVQSRTLYRIRWSDCPKGR